MGKPTDTDDNRNSLQPVSSISALPERLQRFSDENFNKNNVTKLNEIAGAVAALLVHYWTADDDAISRRLQVADWIQDLMEFPIGAIQGAIITWRRSQTKRPTPADIRKLILPDPKSEFDEGGGAAYRLVPKSRLTLKELAKHRQAIAPLWDLVRRARDGEDAEMLVAERRRMSEEIFARDPDLRRINKIIEQEEQDERRPR